MCAIVLYIYMLYIPEMYVIMFIRKCALQY